MSFLGKHMSAMQYSCGVSGANEPHADVSWGGDEEPGPKHAAADGDLLLSSSA